MVLVFIGKILNLHAILSELRQLQKALLELPGLFSVLFNLLILLLIHDFIFKSAFHDALSNLFNAFDEEAL